MGATEGIRVGDLLGIAVTGSVGWGVGGGAIHTNRGIHVEIPKSRSLLAHKVQM